jgi:hypothetical protein
MVGANGWVGWLAVRTEEESAATDEIMDAAEYFQSVSW